MYMGELEPLRTSVALDRARPFEAQGKHAAPYKERGVEVNGWKARG